MSRARLVQLGALLCAAGLVFAAATRVPAINAGREHLNIRGSESPVENAPPEYAFAVQVLGAFRGLITDIAFIRAELLKEEGRYFDAMQLAKWICALQPHFPSVWEFASWNMAWNISVTTFTPEERWNWVYNGVKLLRDQGIPLNPRAVNLYKQLAWTFNNKMGETLDEFHQAYKCQWAWRMHLVLGPPPDPYRELDAAGLADRIGSAEDVDRLAEAALRTARQHEERRRRQAEERGQDYRPRDLTVRGGLEAPAGRSASFELAQQAALERLRAIAAAPPTLAALHAEFPATRGMVAALRELGIIIRDEPLTEDTYWRSEGLAFTLFQPYRELTAPAGVLARIVQRPADDPRAGLRAQLDRILGVGAQDPAGQALLRFVQRKVLREVYKLEPEVMIQLAQTFGPIDWRAVDSQSLYWTWQGLVAGGETLNDFRNDKTNTARILFFSLRNLFLYGRIVFEPNPEKVHLSYLHRTIDPHFIEPLNEAFIRYARLFDPEPGGGDRGAGDTFRTGHINFLSEVIRRLYLAGYEADAARYYDVLRESYPTDLTGRPNENFRKPLREYVLAGFLESVDVPGLREAEIVISSLLSQACDELAAGDFGRYSHLVRRAREFHEEYMRGKREPGYERMRLPEFVDMEEDIFGTWLSRIAYTPDVTLHKVRAWRYAPLYLRQRVYDVLLERLAAECTYWNFDVAKAFPAPPGMADFRATHPERYQKERPGDIETLPQTLNQ